MPWRATGPVDERMAFVVAAQTGETSLAEVCRSFGISRKTGYKWLGRYQAEGVAGLVPRSRAPHTHPRAISGEMEDLVLRARATHPTWGPRKLLAWLGQQEPARVLPAASTVGEALGRAGLVVARPRKRHATPHAGGLTPYSAANRVWCADFKGNFRLGDGRSCYPLTITDGFSRYLLRCQALSDPDLAHVQPLFAATFREYGLPETLRTDNGPPFASTGLAGLSRLGVWWIRLGIRPERIAPGEPGQNGRHERMHRTLKAEAIAPPAADLRAQQRAFDRFRQEYNAERPHEALEQVPPATVYTPSLRPYPRRLLTLEYPEADAVRQVRTSGELYWRRQFIYLTTALAGERVGVRQLESAGQWEVRFGPLVLGILDERQGKLLPQHGHPLRETTMRNE